MPVTFTPQDDTSELEVSVRMPEGTSLEATDVMANRIATAVRRIPEVDYTMVTVAGDGAATRNTASVYTKLKPLEERDRDVFELVADIRTTILPAHVPEDVRTSVAVSGGLGGGGGGRRRRHPVRDAGSGPAGAADAERAAGRQYARRFPASSTSIPT